MPLVKYFDQNDSRIVTDDFLSEFYKRPTRRKGESDKDYEARCLADETIAKGLVGSQAVVAFKEQLIRAVLLVMKESYWALLEGNDDFPTLDGKFQFVLDCMNAYDTLDPAVRSYLFQLTCKISPALRAKGYDIDSRIADEIVKPDGSLSYTRVTRVALEALKPLTKGRDVPDEIIRTVVDGLNRGATAQELAKDLEQYDTVKLSSEYRDADYVVMTHVEIVEMPTVMKLPAGKLVITVDIPDGMNPENFKEGVKRHLAGSLTSQTKFPINNGTPEKLWCTLDVNYWT